MQKKFSGKSNTQRIRLSEDSTPFLMIALNGGQLSAFGLSIRSKQCPENPEYRPGHWCPTWKMHGWPSLGVLSAGFLHEILEDPPAALGLRSHSRVLDAARSGKPNQLSPIEQIVEGSIQARRAEAIEDFLRRAIHRIYQDAGSRKLLTGKALMFVDDRRRPSQYNTGGPAEPGRTASMATGMWRVSWGGTTRSIRVLELDHLEFPHPLQGPQGLHLTQRRHLDDRLHVPAPVDPREDGSGEVPPRAARRCGRSAR